MGKHKNGGETTRRRHIIVGLIIFSLLACSINTATAKKEYYIDKKTVYLNRGEHTTIKFYIYGRNYEEFQIRYDAHYRVYWIRAEVIPYGECNGPIDMDSDYIGIWQNGREQGKLVLANNAKCRIYCIEVYVERLYKDWAGDYWFFDQPLELWCYGVNWQG